MTYCIGFKLPSFFSPGLPPDFSMLESDLKTIFDPAAETTEEAAPEAAFAHMGLDTAYRAPATPDVLPTAESLPRPDVLLTETTPYLCTISTRGSEIDAQFSHEGTLNLVARYLTMHGRPDQNHVGKVSIMPPPERPRG